jgi:uncharacterized protein YndB with AHSA1/START domain
MNTPYRHEIFIAAEPETVFDHFLTPELIVQWMGDVARLVPQPGGLFSVDINGVLIRGEYLRIERPRLLELTWGQLGNDAMPPGTTRVLITLMHENEGTRLSLEHSGLVVDEAAKHAIGWPHFIERLAILARGANPGRDPWADQFIR